MTRRGLQHVSSPFPQGGQQAVRDFYGGVLGMTELPPPKALGHLTLVWFAAGEGLELHFFQGEVDPKAARHFCIDVDDLETTRRQLESAGLKPYEDTAIPNRPRFFCRDPFGNLVEFTSIQGDYRSAE